MVGPAVPPPATWHPIRSSGAAARTTNSDTSPAPLCGAANGFPRLCRPCSRRAETGGGFVPHFTRREVHGPKSHGSLPQDLAKACVRNRPGGADSWPPATSPPSDMKHKAHNNQKESSKYSLWSLGRWGGRHGRFFPALEVRRSSTGRDRDSLTAAAMLAALTMIVGHSLVPPPLVPHRGWERALRPPAPWPCDGRLGHPLTFARGGRKPRRGCRAGAARAGPARPPRRFCAGFSRRELLIVVLLGERQPNRHGSWRRRHGHGRREAEQKMRGQRDLRPHAWRVSSDGQTIRSSYHQHNQVQALDLVS